MFQGFRIEHSEGQTTIFPYGATFATESIVLTDGGDIIHNMAGGKNTPIGKLVKHRQAYTLAELQQLCINKATT